MVRKGFEGFSGRRIWSVPEGLYASALAILPDGRIAFTAGRPTVETKQMTLANTPEQDPSDPFYLFNE